MEDCRHRVHICSSTEVNLPDLPYLAHLPNVVHLPCEGRRRFR
jgi:hypothetical protein